MSTNGVIIPQNFLLEGYYTRYGLQDWAIDRYKALVRIKEQVTV